MQIVLTNVKPYDGRYKLDFDEELNTREWRWIKQLTGYLPLTLETGMVGGDPEVACAWAVIALYRAGRIDQTEVADVYEKLLDAPFGTSITIDVTDEPVEDDAGPPPPSSNGSEATSGPSSPTSSETSEQIPPGSGIPGLAISQSGPPTSVS